MDVSCYLFGKLCRESIVSVLKQEREREREREREIEKHRFNIIWPLATFGDDQ